MGRNGQASHALYATAPASYSAGDPRGRVPATGMAVGGGGPAAPRGARQARSATERGQEPDRGPGAGRGVWLPGLRLSARPLLAGALAAAVYAQAHAGGGVAGGAQGDLPTR